MHWHRPRGLLPKMRASRRFASGHPTRTWRSAFAATALCRSTAEQRQSAMQKVCDRSSASIRSLIPDFLALVGDAADGYPGIAGIGAVSAARLLNRHGAIENFPAAVLGDRLAQALLFKDLATLRTDAALFKDADDLRWNGATGDFDSWTERLQAPRLLDRCLKAEKAAVRNEKSCETGFQAPLYSMKAMRMKNHSCWPDVIFATVFSLFVS